VGEDSGVRRFPDLQAGEELSEEESWFTERGDSDTINPTAPVLRKSA
jgi:hypothetical protein